MTGIIEFGTNAADAAAPGAGAAVVVLEAAGVIGRGLLAAALEVGHPVVAVDRDLAALAALAAQHPQLVAVPGSARDESDARELARALRALGRPLLAAIAAVDAGRMRGRLLDQAADATCAALQASLAPQLAAARHLLPLLAECGYGSFVLVGGPGGRHPWAGYGQRSLVEASLRMLARVLHDEAQAQGVRLQLLSVDTPTCGLHGGPPRAHWPSALQIGQRAMQLLAPGGSGEAVVEFALAHVAAPAQAADSDAALLPPGCLQDARTLLRGLAGAKPSALPKAPPNASRRLPEHDRNYNYNQESSPR